VMARPRSSATSPGDAMNTRSRSGGGADAPAGPAGVSAGGKSSDRAAEDARRFTRGPGKSTRRRLRACPRPRSKAPGSAGTSVMRRGASARTTRHSLPQCVSRSSSPRTLPSPSRQGMERRRWSPGTASGRLARLADQA
jgi:hypothetical protein